jgi:hypothetical protein
MISMVRAIAALLWISAWALAQGPVYVTLWFDTEDYVEPAADDAAMRLALELEKRGVRATFKVVGEKARVLEQRGRWDVVRALARHDIGYHTDNHSLQPVPAVYLRDTGWLEGAEEFARREGPGFRDVARIFGAAPSTYGQPGSSWGPQSHRALKKWGVPTYVDEGSQVSLGGRPFWFAGLLHVFGMGKNVMRADIDDESKLGEARSRFDAAAAALRSAGGGVISVYYHPTEFVTTEFWDGVNFSKGATRERADWVKPRRRSAEAEERAYRILMNFVEHVKGVEGVRFVTCREIAQLHKPAVAPAPDKRRAAAHLARGLTFLEEGGEAWSAAELLLALLGVEPREVEGPVARRETTYSRPAIPRAPWERAKADAAGFIRAHGRLPAEVWVGPERLSLADFAATLAGDALTGGQSAAPVKKGILEMETRVATDGKRSYGWAIHPEGFDGSPLLELTRLQAWTLKPAKLK